MTLDPTNPFAAPSPLPFELPDFAAIRLEHYRPAIEAGMTEQLAEIAKITANPEPPSIANTLEAFEASGAVLRRATYVLFNLTSSCATPELQELEEELTPQLTAHRDAIYLDAALYGRIAALYERRAEFDAETSWVLHRLHRDFVRAGVRLDDAQQARLRELNAEISTLETGFGNMLLREMNDLAVPIDDEAALAGLAPDAVASLAEAARRRGIPGYLVELQLPTAQPALEEVRVRATRRAIQQASEMRGTRGGANDVRETIRALVRLRAEKAALLGYEHYAAYVAEEETAQTTQAVMAMLSELAPKAVANARREGELIEAALRRDEPGAELEACDWQLYSAAVREEKYAFDAARLRPYFELERVVRDGVFYAAGRLYGLSFTERPDLVAYHPDARVFEVSNADGSPLGLFVCDYFTRDTKRGGAWMNSFVEQSRLLGQLPVVCNTLNIVRAPEGEATLLSVDEVETLFHEFGHALHGLFSQVHYPSASGTNVPRDFVEFPSQVNEMWAFHPEILANYARHVETGEPVPADLVEAMQAAKLWGEGFATTEYLGAALLDQAWHQLTDAPDDVAAFEAAALAAAGLDYAPVPPRYRSGYFQHIFTVGYAAAYYSYIWSEVLDADTVAWFEENGGLRRENGDRFREALLSRGGAGDPLEFFRDLRGRDPEIGPLLARRGLW